MTCKGDTFVNYKVPIEDLPAIAGRALSVHMTRWSHDTSHMGYAKLARDTGDKQVIDMVDELLVALAAAKAAIEAYVKVRP